MATASYNNQVDRNMWFWILGWLFTVLTVAGNGLVTFLILKKPQLQTKPNCFILSLAVADCFVGVVYFPQIFIHSFTCHSYVCDGAFFITRHYFQYCSITNLCAMLADRYISIVKPLKHVAIITRKRIIFLLVASWTAPVIAFVVPQITILLFANEEQDSIFSILKTLTFNTLPMILLIVLSTRVLVVARNLSRESRALNAQVRFNYRSETIVVKIAGRSEIFERQATAKMMIAVMVIFILCSAAEHWKGFCSCKWNINCELSDDIANILDLLCILNSAVNPIAYGFLKRDFKEQLKRLFGHNRH